MLQSFQSQPFNNQTVTPATAAVNDLSNLTQSSNPVVVLVITTGAPTGASPTLSFTLLSSVDGVNYAQVATSQNINAAGTYRYVIQNVLEPVLGLQPNVSAGASFPNVTATILMTSPD